MPGFGQLEAHGGDCYFDLAHIKRRAGLGLDQGRDRRQVDAVESAAYPLLSESELVAFVDGKRDPVGTRRWVQVDLGFANCCVGIAVFLVELTKQRSIEFELLLVVGRQSLDEVEPARLCRADRVSQFARWERRVPREFDRFNLLDFTFGDLEGYVDAAGRIVSRVRGRDCLVPAVFPVEFSELSFVGM